MENARVGYLVFLRDGDVAYIEDTALGPFESWPLRPEITLQRAHADFDTALDYVRSLRRPFIFEDRGQDLQRQAQAFAAEMERRSRIPVPFGASAVLVLGVVSSLTSGQPGLAVALALLALLTLGVSLVLEEVRVRGVCG